MLFIPTLLSLASCCAAALTYKGYDISSLISEESAGVTYTSSSGGTEALETIIAAAGATSIKLRLWVDPADGVYNLNYSLALGARAAAAGLGVQLNLHYSDTWADPGTQTPPAAWAALGIDGLVAEVSSYTTDVVRAFTAAGITPEIVSVGNEIRAGILWPLGKYDQPANLARLLNAGAAAVRAASPSTLVMLHTDRGYDWDTQRWFYDDAVAAGLDLDSVDVLGVSYYPYWDATLSTLQNFETTITNLASTYGKQVMVQETDWPVACSDTSDIPSSLTSEFAFSEEGQKAWVERLGEIVAAVDGGKGLGVMYWEPAWIDNQSLGSPCEDNTMFTGTWSGDKAVASEGVAVAVMAEI
ncbi:family 53 glycosyl hydrolase [Geopyxis carbonaria]|nr:family 53 glycosyl hydrolase [Geopyxis carbonaria]